MAQQSSLERLVPILLSGITKANEVFLLFNQWIVTTSPDCSWPLLRSAITTIAYAISEPIYTNLFLHWPVPLTLILWLCPIHLCLCIFMTYETHSWPNGALDVKYMQPSLRHQNDHFLFGSALLMLVPVQTCAIINAALGMLNQSMHTPEVSGNSAIALLSSFALLLYVCSRFGDYIVSKRLHRPPFIATQGPRAMHIMLLVLLVATRAATNLALGVQPFRAFQPMSPHDAKDRFGNHQTQRVRS